MIARHEARTEAPHDVWARLAAPVPQGEIAWRQDGLPVQRDGRYFARWVAYIEAGTVRERLDAVVCGEWNLTLELLPAADSREDALEAQPFAFKARLQILGVVREDVGTGRDYKQASTDAFKRVAVRFGIGGELYQMGQNWVRMDGDGKFAKALEDPQECYDRRAARAASGSIREDRSAGGSNVGEHTLSIERGGLAAVDTPPCPKCGGKVWDNRAGKRNPKAPDFKCRDRSCEGVVWPSKQDETQAASPLTEAAPATVAQDEIPF